MKFDYFNFVYLLRDDIHDKINANIRLRINQLYYQHRDIVRGDGSVSFIRGNISAISFNS